MKYKKKIKMMQKAIGMLEKAGILVHKEVDHSIEIRDDENCFVTKLRTGEMQVKLFIHIKP